MLEQDESTGILKMLPVYWSADVKLPTDHCIIFSYYESYNTKSIFPYRYASRVSTLLSTFSFCFCSGIE